jgi:hypothetical protein
MGIRDALRSMRGADKNPTADGDDEVPEPTWFQPRHDGSYHSEPSEPGAPAEWHLRFLSTGKVFESSGGDGGDGPDQHSPRHGEYTGAGRFHVQRQFERLVSYAVPEPDGPQDQIGFRAHRVDSADRSTLELQFLFRPDGS